VVVGGVVVGGVVFGVLGGAEVGPPPVHEPPLRVQLAGSARPPPSVTRKPMVALPPGASEKPPSWVAVNLLPLCVTLAPHQFCSRSPEGRVKVRVNEVIVPEVPLASRYCPWK
jgi:hypothetical protein